MTRKDEIGVTLSRKQAKLVQAVFDHLEKTGNWPKARLLQVAFQKEGDLWDIASEIDRRILILGDKYQEDSKAKLTVDGLALCKGSMSILKLFILALRVCVKQYIKIPENPLITYEQLRDELAIDDNACGIACLLLEGEARILHTYSILPDGKKTSFKLSPDILRLNGVRSIGGYLTILHKEKNERDRERAAAAMADRLGTHEPGDFLTRELKAIARRVIKDEKLRDTTLQTLDELDSALWSESWQSVCVLSGTACEGLLDAVMEAQADERGHPDRFIDKIKRAMTLHKVDERVSRLMDYIRDMRNVVHPSKARLDSGVSQTTALVTYALLGAVYKSIDDTH